MIPANRCERCLIRRSICICAELPRVAPSAHFVIVRHVLERFKTANTGRLAALALGEHATLVDYATPDAPLPRLDTPPGTVVLFPDTTTPVPEKITKVIVLDASWSQARRMLQRMPALRALPRLSLPAPAGPRRRLRRPFLAEGMSTLEAIAAAVARIDGDELARPLDRLYSSAVLRSIAGREPFTPELLAEIRADAREAEAVMARLARADR